MAGSFFCCGSAAVSGFGPAGVARPLFHIMKAEGSLPPSSDRRSGRGGHQAQGRHSALPASPWGRSESQASIQDQRLGKEAQGLARGPGRARGPGPAPALSTQPHGSVLRHARISTTVLPVSPPRPAPLVGALGSSPQNFGTCRSQTSVCTGEAARPRTLPARAGGGGQTVQRSPREGEVGVRWQGSH